MQADKIVATLNNLDSEDNPYKSILINGPWGVGKTNYVNEFTHENNQVICISLFGKKNTQQILEEIYYKVIKNTKFGIFKKGKNKITQLLSNSTVEFSGMSISIPMITDIYKSLEREIKNKSHFFLIFDDFERKHDDLLSKEVLGLIDNLSQLENIKIVLIADIEKLCNEDKANFDEFKEKALDKIYNITSFADNAPEMILSEDVWNTIKKVENISNVKNLRTFKKIKIFIEETKKKLTENELQFTDNFSANDIYRICSAIVYFTIHLNKEMTELDQDKSADSRTGTSSSNYSDSEYARYIDEYILHRSLENIQCQQLIIPLLDFYETGYWDEKIKELVKSINSRNDYSKNLFSSDIELKELIKDSEASIVNFNQDDSTYALLSELSVSMLWAEILQERYSISNDEIISNISDKIISKVNVKYSLMENLIDPLYYSGEDSQFDSLLFAVNDLIEITYAELLFEKLTEQIDSHVFETKYLDYLKELLYSNGYREEYKRKLLEKDYFFAVPLEKITEAHWNWCYHIKNTMLVSGLEKEFKEYLEKIRKELREVKNDKIALHRVNIFLDEA